MRLKHRILLGALATALTLLLQGLTEAPTNAPGQTEAPTEVIYEDDERWDCRTMGNRICGEWNEQQGQIELIYYPPGWEAAGG